MLHPDRRDVEPRILLPEKCDVLLVLHDLDRMRAADRAQQTKRQAASGVVAFGGIVTIPSLFAPLCEWKVLDTLATGFVLGDIGHARSLPYTAKVRLAVPESRR